ncbi:hypothetical protein QE152_g8061 [Popillia japonica]|uniref:Uncharacterized protein n=1 Tax=Popillia japonica TaxID=7064 RepID=A0AAW1MC94_POPJA
MARNAVLSLLNELHQQKTELLQPHKRRELFSEIAKILQTQGHDVSLEMENSSGNGVITWELYNNVAAIVGRDPSYNPIATIAVGAAVGRDPSYNPIATIAVGAAGGITRKIQEKEKETNDKKRFKLSKTYIEEQFDGVNENIRNIDWTYKKY